MKVATGIERCITTSKNHVLSNGVCQFLTAGLRRFCGAWTGPIFRSDELSLGNLACRCGGRRLQRRRKAGPGRRQLNHDGKTDLAIAAEPAGSFVMLGNGDGTFSLAPNPQNPVHGGYGFGDLSSVVADLNNDSKLDLIAIKIDAANEIWTVEWGLGNGDGTFQGPIGNVNPCTQSSDCIPLSYSPNSLR